MRFDDIKTMVAKDMVIDSSELDTESLKIPQLHNKYLNLFHDERILLRKLEADKRELVRDKWEFYSGKMSQEELDNRGWVPFQLKILKQDLDMYIHSDSDVTKVDDRITLQKEKVDYLSSILKSITGRGWEIKNAIEWRKFTSGI
jgi:hypothetical protein|tara:strand:- start:2184 stop:2618 length:435 start_codon:yes stop_codon:yes gene_type:complete